MLKTKVLLGYNCSASSESLSNYADNLKTALLKDVNNRPYSVVVFDKAWELVRVLQRDLNGA